MPGRRPSTPDNAIEAGNFKAGQKVYYAFITDGKLFVVGLKGRKAKKNTAQWKEGKIVEKESSEGSDKYQVS
jgi:hypothetical protein